MSMIRIKLYRVTVHRRHPDSTARVDLVSGLSVPAGQLDTIAIPPGTAFLIDEAEGRALLAVHAGEIVGGAP